MAAFTTLALLGLAAAGGVAAGKKLAPKKAADAPGPTDVMNRGAAATAAMARAGEALKGGPVPPDATQARSDAQSLAMTAATKQKRKARGGGTQIPASSNPVASAQLAPRTLLGY